MILITGATGQLGQAIIASLREKGVSAANIAALVRDEKKANGLKGSGINIRVGNYDDTGSLVKAFHGVDKLMFISGSEIPKREQQHLNVVEAAKQADVKYIVYTSFMRKNEKPDSPIAAVAASHIVTEESLRKSGIPYSIMKNALYADMLPIFLGQQVLESGVHFPAGDGSAAYTLREDMAEAAAAILTEEGHANKEYDIASGDNHSFSDIADILSEVSGKNIVYGNLTKEQYVERATRAGLPSAYADVFAGFGEAIKLGEFATESGQLEEIIGRKPVSLKSYLKNIYQASN
ncbi:SDR family oxidoreductase [Pollutibacter soli]|uniref:SDR family oxidoreductase n=1 Tax=Pollutibacter soli TaxID=3034157 RepID=UPI0030132CC6